MATWGKGLYDFTWRKSPQQKAETIKKKKSTVQEAMNENTGEAKNKAAERIEWFKTTSPQERVEDRKQNLQKSMANIQKKVEKATAPAKERIKKAKIYMGIQKPENVEEYGDIYVNKRRKKNRVTQGFE